MVSRGRGEVPMMARVLRVLKLKSIPDMWASISGQLAISSQRVEEAKVASRQRI
jgi:hypothetical protein